MSSRLLTAAEVAERLSVPKSWVYRQAREGDLPHVPCGRYVRFDAADLENWIEEQKSPRAAATAGGATPGRYP